MLNKNIARRTGAQEKPFKERFFPHPFLNLSEGKKDKQEFIALTIAADNAIQPMFEYSEFVGVDALDDPRLCTISIYPTPFRTVQTPATVGVDALDDPGL